MDFNELSGRILELNKEFANTVADHELEKYTTSHVGRIHLMIQEIIELVDSKPPKEILDLLRCMGYELYRMRDKFL